jgi:DNA-binding transcriptional LysR family regulator
MSDFTLHEISCFDAVASAGSFQAAAAKLHRTHPTVYAAVKNLETQLGLALLDRRGYRVGLTEAGRAFQQRAKALLGEARALQSFAAQLAMGEESELSVVIGDLCPTAKVLRLLRQFFDKCPGTRLHLHFEAISGPWERLFDEEADLIVHHIDKSDQRIEFVDLFSVDLIPVVAPGFLSFPITRSIAPSQMRAHVQCIIRDSARRSATRDYFVLEGAHSWTVADQLMKKELIVLGMGWGHLPTFLIQQELRKGQLLPIVGKHYKGGSADIVVARLSNRPHGPVANRLWQFMEEQAPKFTVKSSSGRQIRRSR